VKHLLLILVLIVPCLQVQALQSLEGTVLREGDSFGFTLEPSFGYLKGQAREIVYDTGNESTKGMSSSNGYYLSELIWDLTDIVYTGLSASLNFNNRLYVNAGVWTAVSKGRGYMDDYDWVYFNNVAGRPYYLHDRNGKVDLSHWSYSSVDVVNSVIFDFNLSYDFLRDPKWSFLTTMGYKYTFWDWSDIVLDSMYDQVDDVLTVGINAIDYALGLHIPYFGIRGGYSNNPGLILKGNLVYSPFVVGMAHDHHILRYRHFYDRTFMGQYLAGSLEAGYRFSPLFSLKVVIFGDYLFESKGITYVYDDYGNFKGSIPGGAGIQYQAFSLSLNASFSF